MSARLVSSNGSSSAGAEPSRDEDRPLTTLEVQGLEDFQASKRWFLSHEAEFMQSHAGQFIAIHRGILIAASPRFAELLANLPLDCDRGHLFVRRIPASDDPDEILWS